MTTTLPRLRSLALTLLIGVFAHSASAALVWVENVNGDLSSDPGAPTSLTFSAGVNTILGTVTASGDTRDYITFTVETGTVLTGIFLRKYVDEATGGPGDRGFHAISLGTEGVIPDPTTAGDLLGGDHLDPVGPNVNLLEVLAGAPLAGTGFDTPLGAGDYTYLVQQTSPLLTSYVLDFVIKPAPVPLPMAGWLFLSGLAALGTLKRRTR